MSEFKFGLFRVSLVSSFYDSPRATRRQVSQLGARGRQWCDWKFFSIEPDLPLGAMLLLLLLLLLRVDIADLHVAGDLDLPVQCRSTTTISLLGVHVLGVEIYILCSLCCRSSRACNII